MYIDIGDILFKPSGILRVLKKMLFCTQRPDANMFHNLAIMLWCGDPFLSDMKTIKLIHFSSLTKE